MAGKAREIEKNLRDEVSIYDSYLRGEVYGYIIEDGKSCFGFYDIDYCISEAKDMVDYELNRQKKEVMVK